MRAFGESVRGMVADHVLALDVKTACPAIFARPPRSYTACYCSIVAHELLSRRRDQIDVRVFWCVCGVFGAGDCVHVCA